jgi:hypothetical protein
VDATRFDTLTRKLTASLSRRRLAMTGIGILSVLGAASPDEADARLICRPPGVRCNGACCRGHLVCRRGRCRLCNRFRCPDGRCLAKSCGGVCCDKGTICCAGVCCAAGETCSEAGTCTPCTTLTNSCVGEETQCTVDKVIGRCATSNEGGNYCVEYGFPCVPCASDQDCTMQLGQAAICVTCEGCGAAGLACAKVMAPA